MRKEEMDRKEPSRFYSELHASLDLHSLFTVNKGERGLILQK